jgi:hypothetical protein
MRTRRTDGDELRLADAENTAVMGGATDFFHRQGPYEGISDLSKCRANEVARGSHIIRQIPDKADTYGSRRALLTLLARLTAGTQSTRAAWIEISLV